MHLCPLSVAVTSEGASAGSWRRQVWRASAFVPVPSGLVTKTQNLHQLPSARGPLGCPSVFRHDLGSRAGRSVMESRGAGPLLVWEVGSMTVLLQSMDMVETSPEIPFPVTMCPEGVVNSKTTTNSSSMAFFLHMEPQDSTRSQLVLRWDGQERFLCL